MAFSIMGDNVTSNYLSGGSLNDSIAGMGGADTLDGGAGADTMAGGLDDDLYFVDNVGDVVREVSRQGIDTVLLRTGVFSASSMEIENITGDLAGIAYHITGHAVSNRLTGHGLNDTLTGLGGADTLNGLAGDDRLVGGLGKDSLIGGEGQDRFVFDSALGASNVDTVQGYNLADDTILLDRRIFAGFSGTGTLAESAFVSGDGAVASEADDRIIYNTSTGALLYDADGNGAVAAIQFATLTPIVGIVTNAEFLII
jgi:Ca2+-binding RTX toxin-like protein